MMLPTLLPSLRRMLGDRRGVTAVVFAASVVPLFGAVALATDAGVWYSARRGAGNAADMSALAAAAVLPRSGEATARLAAADVSGRNGFAHGGINTVEVNIPPASGPNRGNPAAVEVIVRQQQRLAASGMFLRSAPIVAGRSVAAVRDSRPVCFLALAGGFTVAGSATISAPECALASNRTSGPGFDFSGSGQVTAFTASAVTTCDGCDDEAVQLTQPAAEGQLPASNPYAHLDTKVLPSFNGSSCLSASNNPTSLSPYESNGRRAYCDDIRVAAGATLTLTPGTYYLHNASLRVNGGGRLECPTCTGGEGVTIVLTGDPSRIGEIDINGGAMVGLRAPENPQDPDYRGILFYRDIRATGGGGTAAVKIAANAEFDIEGGLYFPSSTVQFSGASATDGCMVLVADTIELRGGSSAGVSSCAGTGTGVSYTQVARIIE
ncbi:pilus assembly protein TadG-related protein [Falsiroseomonas sp.]|uniref:pilus assembly protein TadG-related protein n=1 Tax=Falsiroseomonas sp. TaxID=2870721 RepID=UPI0035643C45